MFEDRLEPSGRETADLFPRVARDLEVLFGWPIRFSPTILLIGDRNDFIKMAGGDLFVAFAVPQKKLIVMDHSKLNARPFSLEGILKHELCHLLLHDYIKRKNLPKWLDEGIAQWASDGVTELIMNRKRSALNSLLLSKGRFSIRSLNHSFPRDPKGLMLAYEAGKSMVTFMVGQYGAEGVISILEQLKAGRSFDQALSETVSISFEDLESNWHAHLKKRRIWLSYLSYYIYEIVFFLAALMMIIGSIRVIRKKRAALREWEDD